MVDANDSEAESIESAGPGGTSPGRASDAAPPMPTRGAMVGRYVALDELGAGAMGVVYRAFDPELSRQVALKVLRVRGFGAESAAVHRARLLREGQAMAKLAHRNTVAVFDVGADGPWVFLAMEWVRGSNLRQWLAAGARPWAQLEPVFAGAAAGLQAAHRHGLVHRDFKPENVLIADDGRVCVGDFGLARPAPSTAPDVMTEGTAASVVLTHDGDVVGTPLYMAPEQHLGAAADGRADQYAFCVVLYEAIYGQRPFEGRDVATMLAAKRAGLAEPPAWSPGGDGVPRWRVPRWLRALLRRGLAWDRERRFADMDAIVEAFARGRARRRRAAWIIGGAVAAAAVGAWSIGGRGLDDARCRPAVPAAWDAYDRDALAAAFAAAEPGYGAALAPWVTRALEHARTHWQATHVQVCEATWRRGEQSAELLDVRMACLRRAWDRIAAATALFAEADRAVVAHAIELVDELPDAGRCREHTGPAESAADQARVRAIEQALASIRAQRRVDREREAAAALAALMPEVIALGDPRLRIEALLLHGAMQDARGESAPAHASLREAMGLAKATGVPTLEAEAWIALANVVGYSQHDYDEGRFYGALALAAIEAAGDDALLRAWAETALGSIEFVAGEDQRAQAHWRAALARRQAVLTAPHHLIAASLNNLGGVAYATGEYDAADAELTAAMDMRVALFGVEHPSVSESAINLALVRVAQGRADEAVGLAERALAIQRAANGDDHPNVGRAHDALAGALQAAGRAAAALEHADRARAIYTAAWGPAHPGLHAVTLTRARALLGLGRADEAQAALRALLEAALPAELRDEVQAELERARLSAGGPAR